MQKAAAQSLGFHIIALVLLAIGAVMAMHMTREANIVMMKVDGKMVASHIVARGAACPNSGELQMSEPTPVRNSSYPD